MDAFHICDCIRKTKHRIPLTDAELQALVQGVVAQDAAARIPDYQLAAWLMAVCFSSLTQQETTALTFAMRDSGDRMHWDGLSGVTVDKHSTGGVGDKTTLILAPVVAACGVLFPKMSGRGLGHTGGTIDKLESIPGLQTALTPERFLHLVQTVGCAVAMQSGNLAPADKKLYALRDVTETVDSVPLICASIMSKKLATAADCLLLDVKVGSGAFMKTDAEALVLAEQMLAVAKAANQSCTAVLTDMDRPLGKCIGNALEVEEAISVLQGNLETPLARLCVELATQLLRMANRGTSAACKGQVRAVLRNGAALARFQAMIEGQGGDPAVAEHPERLPQARCQRVVKATASGWIASMQSEEIGRVSVLLGAGRQKQGDAIDPAAGIRLAVQVGDCIADGEPLLTLYAASDSAFAEAEQRLQSAISIANEAPHLQPDIHCIRTNQEVEDA